MEVGDGEFLVELLLLNQSDCYIERVFSIVDKVRNNQALLMVNLNDKNGFSLI